MGRVTWKCLGSIKWHDILQGGCKYRAFWVSYAYGRRLWGQGLKGGSLSAEDCRNSLTFPLSGSLPLAIRVFSSSYSACTPGIGARSLVMEAVVRCYLSLKTPFMLLGHSLGIWRADMNKARLSLLKESRITSIKRWAIQLRPSETSLPQQGLDQQPSWDQNPPVEPSQNRQSTESWATWINTVLGHHWTGLSYSSR